MSLLLVGSLILGLGVATAIAVAIVIIRKAGARIGGDE